MTSLTPPGLAGQLVTLVFEEWFLREIGDEVVEYLGDDRVVTHGPWRAEKCRDVLLRWFDAGWLDCVAVEKTHTLGKPEEVQHYRYDTEWQARAELTGSYWVLARSVARELLGNPEFWSSDGPGADVCLARTEATDDLDYADWIGTVIDITGEGIGVDALPE